MRPLHRPMLNTLSDTLCCWGCGQLGEPSKSQMVRLVRSTCKGWRFRSILAESSPSIVVLPLPLGPICTRPIVQKQILIRLPSAVCIQKFHYHHLDAVAGVHRYELRRRDTPARQALQDESTQTPSKGGRGSPCDCYCFSLDMSNPAGIHGSESVGVRSSCGWPDNRHFSCSCASRCSIARLSLDRGNDSSLPGFLRALIDLLSRYQKVLKLLCTNSSAIFSSRSTLTDSPGVSGYVHDFKIWQEAQ